MLAVASGWWIGWGIALVVILIAATLLLAIIGLGRRIVRQAREITAALDGTRENTAPLFDVVKTNLALDRITRGLHMVRTGEPGGVERPVSHEPDQPSMGPAEALRKQRKGFEP
jgi:hypothetical protein